jgi:hypothetical protein
MWGGALDVCLIEIGEGRWRSIEHRNTFIGYEYLMASQAYSKSAVNRSQALKGRKRSLKPCCASLPAFASKSNRKYPDL